jgi:V/A-type H+-transporting ATPase subunit K
LAVVPAVFFISTSIGVATALGSDGGGAPAAAGASGEVAPVKPPVHWTFSFAIAAAIAIPCLAAGYAVARVGAAALGAASERPELLVRSLLFVALAEGIAIYGLLVAVLLYLKL